MGLQLPDVTGDTVTILKECKDAIERRQEFLRQQIAATLHTLEGMVSLRRYTTLIVPEYVHSALPNTV